MHRHYFRIFSQGRIIATLFVAFALCGAASGNEVSQGDFGDTANDEWGKVADNVLPEKPNQRIREGTRLVDIKGYFSEKGQGWEFNFKDESRSLIALQNLALERIANSMDGNHERVWSISGQVTEYEQRNYLLITRAVIKNKVFEQKEAPPKKKLPTNKGESF